MKLSSMLERDNASCLMYVLVIIGILMRKSKIKWVLSGSLIFSDRVANSSVVYAFSTVHCSLTRGALVPIHTADHP